MADDLEKKDRAQLENQIANYRRAGRTNDDYFRALCDELQKRKGFNAERSRAVIFRAAKEGRCLSYKDLADESGLDWARVHYGIGAHLWELLEPTFRKDGILLSAIVVNKASVAAGTMEEGSIKGFIKAAEDLGLEVPSDHQAFVTEQQNKVFDWAQTREKP
jgi:hypothetical protein